MTRSAAAKANAFNWSAAANATRTKAKKGLASNLSGNSTPKCALLVGVTSIWGWRPRASRFIKARFIILSSFDEHTILMYQIQNLDLFLSFNRKSDKNGSGRVRWQMLML